MKWTARLAPCYCGNSDCSMHTITLFDGHKQVAHSSFHPAPHGALGICSEGLLQLCLQNVDVRIAVMEATLGEET